MNSDISDKRILVTGLVKNGGGTLITDISRLQLALRQFRNLHWLVIESDSTDETTNVLNNMQAEISNFRYISLGKLSEKFPLRTERIAHCRNQYLHEISTNQQYSDIDYIIIYDFDNINKLVTEKSVLSCFDRLDWDVCTANQSSRYYDIFALRHKFWSPNNSYSQYRFFLEKKVKASLAYNMSIYSRMIKIPNDSEWIEVDSAYGGVAIYKREAIEGARYIGLDEKGKELCEHVPFHEQIRKKGYRIFINPGFINAGYTEHIIKSQLKLFLLRVLGLKGFELMKKIFRK